LVALMNTEYGNRSFKCSECALLEKMHHDKSLSTKQDVAL
jgi:hypothetical protein